MKRTGTKPNSSKAAQSSSGWIHFNLWYGVCLVFGMLLMALLQYATPWFGRGKHSGPATAGAAVVTGPWGRIERIKFSLVQPEDYLPDSNRPLQTPKWFFQNYSQDRLVHFFKSLQLDGTWKAQLLDTSKWELDANGIWFTPTRELILGLGQPARQSIYSVLAEMDANVELSNPYRFRLDGFDEWFEHSGLPAEKLKVVRSLTYTNDGALCLADVGVVQQVCTTDEFRRVFHSLYSEPSYLIRLHLTPDSDIDALAKYWGKGGRERTIRPLLKSLSNVPGGGTINISYLLPPFARLRVYTYAPEKIGPAAGDQDCFWTAMNFFNERPDPRLFNYDYALQYIKTAYTPVNGTPTFGDLIMYLDRTGKTVHACIYIADDIVFTKNGADNLQPWVLTTQTDMLAHYAGNHPMRPVTLRLKGL